MKPTTAKKPAVRLPQNFRLDGAREICRLASNGNQIALALAWSAATELAQTILAIAEARPERLKELAPFALYMPALLSRSKSFNNITARLAKQVNLSANLTCNQPGLRLDSLTTRFVVELIERFDWTRTQVQHFANTYHNQPELRKKLRQGMKVFTPGRKTRAKWNCRTLEDYLVKHLDFCPEDLHLLALGRLGKATAPDWWNKVFKPHLENEYTMQSLRGTPLHRQLCAALDVKVSDRSKDYLVKDELKRRCQDALTRFANSFDPSKPPPENR